MERPVILIIDDEPANLAVLTHLLKGDYQILAAKSAKQAYTVMNRGPRPDLILLDVMMPEIDGYSTFTSLRENYDATDIPVIFVTALSDTLDEEAGFSLGAVDYITKPINPTIVQARIKAHLEIKRTRDILKNQKAWLEEEVERRTSENMLIQEVTMKVILELAEARDSITGNHINRIEAYMKLLGRKLQQNPQFSQVLSEDLVNRIVKAAPLHDIGKIGIPDSILLKPGRLTPEEFETMKQHTVIGYKALSRAMDKSIQAGEEKKSSANNSYLGFLETAMQITLSHHERWDGTGYPEGLTGIRIPLPARMLALVDVYDALITARPYKKAWSTEETEAFITANSGKHFDPVIVDAFLQVRKEFAHIQNVQNDLQEPEGPGAQETL
jgi:putative two-component system response regulator